MEEERIEPDKKSLKERLKTHLVATTGIVTQTTPIFALIDQKLGDLSVYPSITARAVAAGVFYCGAGYIFNNVRESSKKYFGLTDDNKRLIGVHDAFYGALMGIPLTPPIYLLTGMIMGEDITFTNTACATLGAMGVGLINGFPACYAMDISKDLMGIEDCERQSYPGLIKRRKPKEKKGLAALLVASSFLLTAVVYHFNNVNSNSESDNKPTIENVVEAQDQNQLIQKTDFTALPIFTVSKPF